MLDLLQINLQKEFVNFVNIVIKILLFNVVIVNTLLEYCILIIIQRIIEFKRLRY